MTMMGDLNELGLKYKTDKSTITHCYLDVYEFYFKWINNRPLVILEIGVAGGASIKMWREYFPNAQVWGIDNNPDCKHDDQILIGSQIDHLFLEGVLARTGEPDIIIDDASHFGPNTIQTFKYLFPRMCKGGWYVVEDTHCFYDETYGQWPKDGGSSAVFNFFSGLSRDVDVAGRGMTGNTEYALTVQNPNFPEIPRYSRILDSMHIHPSLWFFKRKL